MQMLSCPSQPFPVGGMAKAISNETTEDLVCQGAAAESTYHQETRSRCAMQGIENNMFHILKQCGVLSFWHGSLASDGDTSLGPQLCPQTKMQKTFPGWYEQEESVWPPWVGNLQDDVIEATPFCFGFIIVLPIVI